MEKLSRRKNMLIKFILIVAVLLGVALLFGFFSLFTLNKTLALNNEVLSAINCPIKIFDSNNSAMKQDYTVDAPFTKLEDLHDYTISAFISIEDNTFYSHNGLNYKRIVKALINNVKSGKVVEGASTISQQLIKNTHLNSDKTLSRKIKEILLTRKLEQQYTKDEIMELYLNAIYFGSGCYGIESASLFFFGINAENLTLNQSAILAGIIKSPTYYSPINYENDCFNRKNLVLKQMLRFGKISEADYENTKKEQVSLNITQKQNYNDFSYINASISEAGRLINKDVNTLSSEGYKIYTYFDDSKQQILNNSLKSAKAHQNSIIIDNNSGAIEAFCSSIKYGASTLKRCPASTIKPVLVYAPMIESGSISPASIIKDEKTDFNGYNPSNIYDKYYGNVSARQALALSLNVPAVKLLNQNGIKNSMQFATKCGLNFDKNDDNLSLALGAMSYGVSITELCDSYSIFNEGNLLKCTYIKKITDSKGNIVYEHHINKTKVIKESTAYLVGSMMKECVKSGTCKALGDLPFEVRAKTGTSKVDNSENNNSALCIAKTSKNTVCVWFFSTDNRAENTLTPAQTISLAPTLKVKDILQDMYAKKTPESFSRPNSVVKVKLDRLSYENGEIQLASESTPDRYVITELFDKDNTPKDISTKFLLASAPRLYVSEQDKKIKLSFNASPHQKYKIIKTSSSNDLSITIFEKSNFTGEVVYFDNLVTSGETYSYHIECELTNTNNENTIKAQGKEIVISLNKSNNSNKWYT